MSKTVEFNALYEWALPPSKRSVDPLPSARAAKQKSDSFRYLRTRRVPELCGPWRNAAQLGWDILSPVEVTMAPIGDVELSTELPPAELQELASATGLSQIWNRHGSRIGVRDGAWMRLFDFRFKDGWQSMFLPNGMGTIEWIQGVSAEIPEAMSLLIGPGEFADGGAIAEWGLLSSDALCSMREAGTGFSIAIRVTKPTHVTRGQKIARAWVVDSRFLEVNSSA